MTCFRVVSVTAFDGKESSRSHNFTSARTPVEKKVKEVRGGKEEDKGEGEKESACDSRETDTRA